jgi:CRISPR-associated exonuclease Cas4
MLEDDGAMFTVTDLKQYIYCPRIWFYHACLPDVRPVTHKMNAGIEAHEVEQKRAVRRSLNVYGELSGQRHFDLAVQSLRLGLSGKIDEVVQTDCTMIPVDYKLARQTGYHFKLQLAAYAMILEDKFQIQVERGFLYFIPIRKMVEVPISLKLRDDVLEALAEMRKVIEHERMPDPTNWRQRCSDCEFRRFCNDV